MKITTAFRHIIAALGATLVLAKTHELERVAKRNDANGNNTITAFKHPTNNHTTSRSVGLFDLENANTSPMWRANDTNGTNGTNGTDNWVIPVSHWGCTEWTDLGDKPIRSAIEAMIVWGSSPWNWIETKTLHYELADEVGTYVCNCKYCCIDRVPASEMWEFYDRLRFACGGRGRSGWIFSKEWDKGYAVTSAEYIDKKRTKANLCPPNCAVM